MYNLKLNRNDSLFQYPPLNLMNVEDAANVFYPGDYNIYVHIPFCIKKCDFCYYKSYDIKFDEKAGVPNDYFEALLQEIDLYRERKVFDGRICNTIYIGGGTPSLMSLAQIEKLFGKFKQTFNYSSDIEICCEVRPGRETSREKLKLLHEMGVNRISIGCQSLNDSVLRANGRNHNVKWFYNTYDIVRENKFKTVNVDIMSGMVGDNEESFMETVSKVIELRPENIAIYKMELYLNSELSKKVKKNGLRVITDSEEADWVRKAYEFILAQSYSLSCNFSFVSDLANIHSHQRHVWLGEDMIGFGVSSHSKLGLCIYQNDNNIKNYLDMLADDKIPIKRAYKYLPRDEMARDIIFGIKKLKYDTNIFSSKYGIDVEDVFGDQLDFLVDSDFIERKDNMLLTTLEGAIYADDIIKIFYPPEHRDIVMAHFNRV